MTSSKYILTSLLALASATPLTAQAAEAFRFEQLNQIIHERRLVSVQDLMRYLPDSFRKNAVFVLDSQSLQASEKSLPRVLMYGDGDLVISFNADPKQQGYEGIEVMHYDWKKHIFNFREIVFEKDHLARSENLTMRESKATAPSDPTLSFEKMQFENRALREGPKPAICLQCHGEKARPIIPRYPFGGSLLAGYTQNHVVPPNWIADLQRTFETNPRFKELPHFRELLKDPTQLRQQNKAFNVSLTLRNWDRIAYMVGKKASFSVYKYSLLSLIRGCETWANLLPKETQEEIVQNESQYLNRTTAKRKAAWLESFKSSLRFGFPNVNPPQVSDNENSKVALLSLLLEKGLNVRVDEDFTPDGGSSESYFFESAAGGVELFAAPLARMLKEASDPTYAAFTESDAAKSCQTLELEFKRHRLQ